jgi:hypothetical protein
MWRAANRARAPFFIQVFTDQMAGRNAARYRKTGT